jgi:hypothetical protein
MDEWVGAQDMLHLRAVEGGPLLDQDTRQPAGGMVLHLHAATADSTPVHGAYLLTVEGMSAVVAHIATAARQLGPDAEATVRAALDRTP